MESRKLYKELRTAVETNNVELVKKLILEPGVNLCDDGNVIIDIAVKNNYKEIIWMLIHHHRCDIDYKDKYILDMSCKYGNYDIVEFLFDNLQYTIVPFATYIENACKNNHIEVLYSILNFKSVKGDVLLGKALEQVCSDGYFDIAKILIKVKPKIKVTQALKNACDNNHYDIVKMILDDINVSTELSNSLFVKALTDGKYVLCLLLLTSYRIDFQNCSTRLLAIISTYDIVLITAYINHASVNVNSEKFINFWLTRNMPADIKKIIDLKKNANIV